MKERLVYLQALIRPPNLKKRLGLIAGAGMILGLGGFSGVKQIPIVAAFTNGRYDNPASNQSLISPVEQEQLQALSDFIGSSITRPFNKFDQYSTAKQRQLLDSARVELLNGAAYNLDWPLSNIDLPVFKPASKIIAEARLTRKGRSNEVSEYSLTVKGLDKVNQGNLNKLFEPRAISRSSLYKASHLLLNLPPDLRWTFEEPGDGIVIGRAWGNDTFGNSVYLMINSTGTLQYRISK